MPNQKHSRVNTWAQKLAGALKLLTIRASGKHPHLRAHALHMAAAAALEDQNFLEAG